MTTWDHPASRDLYDRARTLLPGGTTRGSIFYRPYPLYAVRGEGCTIEFEGGHRARDFLNNFTSLVLGHGHPAVLRALREQLEAAVVVGAPTRTEVELAEVLNARMPTMERLVFSTTGSEAVMLGLRLARAYTGRNTVAKFEGGYHGGYDQAKVSGMVGPARWKGDAEHPVPVPDTEGLPDSTTSDVRLATFNSITSVRELFEREGQRLAVLVMEPVLGVGGLITPEPGFLEEIRALTERYGVVLFYDEVLTQRLSTGGAHTKFGITPDLVAVSKVLGGGLPISALGGRRDIMELLDPVADGGPVVYHSGTYNANPVSAAAALATTTAITPDVIDHIDRLGELARNEIARLIRDRSLPVSVTGIGSLFNVHFVEQRPRTYRDGKSGDAELLAAFHREMLGEGFLLATRGLGCISAPMEESDVTALVSAVATVLGRLLP
jgi:glutamate-1-semialdehyde 2,1-aminomutase